MANSLLLIPVMKFNASSKPWKMGTFPQYAYPDALARYARVAERIGVKGETDEASLENLIAKIKELQGILGIPSTIKEAIADKGTEAEFLGSLDKMSRDAFDDQCTGANPRYPLITEIRELYLEAYYGEK
jgi:acetaldehyde dehydrogenase/alcohol dehydrogenase